MKARLVFTPFGCFGTLRAKLAQATLFKTTSRQSESGVTFLQLHAAGSQRCFGRNRDTTITADGVGGGNQWEDVGQAGVVGLL